jgi:hypothetical protein
VRDYLGFVIAEATKRYKAGLDADVAIASIDLGKYAGMPNQGRLVQNVAAVYYALDPELPLRPLTEIFGKIADLEGFTADAGLSAATGGGT